jgi:pyrroloquinoline quinone biosynthesis protein B
MGRARGLSRTQDCLAVSGDGREWFLVNCSPDIRAQILATPELAPGPGRRDTPIRGVLLTDAELDHTIGLLALRERTRLDVHAPETVLGALHTGGFPVRDVLAPYGAGNWHLIAPEAPTMLDEHLRVTAIPVGAKRPRYAAAGTTGAQSPWVVAYRFEDLRTGNALLYAPCFGEWTGALDRAMAGVTLLLADGTFFHDDEMRRSAGTGGTARSMGHLPIAESMKQLNAYSGVRRLYTHLNNTNPLLDPDSEECGEVAAAGFEVAEDGVLLES